MATPELEIYRQQPRSSKWLMLIELRELSERKKQEGQSSSLEEARKLINMETRIIDSMYNGGRNYFFEEDYSLFTEAEKLLETPPISVHQQLFVEAEARRSQKYG